MVSEDGPVTQCSIRSLEKLPHQDLSTAARRQPVKTWGSCSYRWLQVLSARGLGWKEPEWHSKMGSWAHSTTWHTPRLRDPMGLDIPRGTSPLKGVFPFQAFPPGHLLVPLRTPAPEGWLRSGPCTLDCFVLFPNSPLSLGKR